MKHVAFWLVATLVGVAAGTAVLALAFAISRHGGVALYVSLPVLAGVPAAACYSYLYARPRFGTAAEPDEADRALIADAENIGALAEQVAGYALGIGALATLPAHLHVQAWWAGTLLIALLQVGLLAKWLRLGAQRARDDAADTADATAPGLPGLS
jgi:hypothetical protein